VTFQRKLLTILALSIFVSVALVAVIVSVMARQAFERSNDERVAALVTQFRGEFRRRQDEVVREVYSIATSETITHMALKLSRGDADTGDYLHEAESLAAQHQLDFLELIDANGAIVSSAQWPATFGYKEAAIQSPADPPASAFLKVEELPDGEMLGLFAARVVRVGDRPLYILGGRRLDREFLASLTLPEGMRVMLYTSPSKEFAASRVLDANGPVPGAEKLSPIVQAVQQSQRESSVTVAWSPNAADSDSVSAIPLNGQKEELLGVLLVANSRRPMVELERRIQSAGLLVAGGGIVFAILFTGWIAARVTRPVREIAAAVREVSAGNWYAQVPEESKDELGELAVSFNRMTRELSEQRQKLVQTERVAAWRELGRRLAHELKNPLFPLQITVENMVRAREQKPELFDETFREGARTLLAELTNLKNIIGRFSEFAKMPQPQLQTMQINDAVQNAARLFQAQLAGNGHPPIASLLELDDALEPIQADPDLLHRALSNLILNAMDAMPEGGALTIRTGPTETGVRIEVSDTGSGLTPEECQRLFTPYYTSKRHGTGLGLAVVQSVVSDHGGRITVQSAPGKGSTFRIELPRNPAKSHLSQS
jgi:two-component system, NtrC family, nitrogen regulation sensor histidine kinase NtrY